MIAKRFSKVFHNMRHLAHWKNAKFCGILKKRLGGYPMTDAQQREAAKAFAEY